jgi:RNA-directed DNA polymerase
MSQDIPARTSDNPARNAVHAALNRPGYRFAVHGTTRERFRGRRNRRSESGRSRSVRESRSPALPPYVAHNVVEFDLANFAVPERLHSVFRILEAEGGPGTGTDRITYADFDHTEIYAALRHLCRKLTAKDYTPHETREVRLPKGDGRFRELQLHRILDRVVAKALQLALDAYWRTRLPRLGKDVPKLYADMQREMQQTGARFLVVSDIRDCFPSAPVDDVLECHRRHFSNEDLLWLIETIVRGHEGPGHTTGLYQGSPYSPVAMELLLHSSLDSRFGTRYRAIPFLLRYADNLNVVCRSEREGREALRFCEGILGDLNFSLKAERPPMDSPMDLRRQHHSRKVLGLNPSWRNGQLHFAIPETAFTDLREGMAQSIIQPHPRDMAMAVATGWLNAMGPALTNAVLPATVDRVTSIARTCGFYELPSHILQQRCLAAYSRWLELTSEGSAASDA